VKSAEKKDNEKVEKVEGIREEEEGKEFGGNKNGCVFLNDQYGKKSWFRGSNQLDFNESIQSFSMYHNPPVPICCGILSRVPQSPSRVALKLL
jgi:hypothetical protein